MSQLPLEKGMQHLPPRTGRRVPTPMVINKGIIIADCNRSFP
jgi:hypothetical protein